MGLVSEDTSDDSGLVIPAEAQPRRSLDARTRNFRGTLLVASREQALQLSDVAAAVWRLADGKRTFADIAQTIAREHSADVEQVAADIRELLLELVAAGLVDRESLTAGSSALPGSGI
jgi:Coenzyme PQQ synthesis protein D (PqqD)